MARFDRMSVYHQLVTSGLVPLFHHNDPEIAWEVVRATEAGGCPVLEFTHRGDSAHEVFAEIERRCRDQLPHVMLGAGSVVDLPTAGIYINTGASFIVAPSFDAETARLCNRRKIAYLPGCATATEIGTAEEAGCEIVKLFPGQVLGPSFVAALRAPSPWSRIMPTGGVEPTEASIREWFAAGAACIGIGSALLSPELIESGNWDALTERVRIAVGLVADQKRILSPGQWSTR